MITPLAGDFRLRSITLYSDVEQIQKRTIGTLQLDMFGCVFTGQGRHPQS